MERFKRIGLFSAFWIRKDEISLFANSAKNYSETIYLSTLRIDDDFDDLTSEGFLSDEMEKDK